ncbi:formylglycine-generating enzyme family protein [Bradyrhizobium sp. Leo170]|uniref:formylglycine-generating enzyme family protein n=1 Tax=Bradyrhizobium sp. Leo170 TaxID=1571199 RepID=UPI001A9131D2|nr:formylglycine-generating enzyme family protein [Bradyrhizobium sp. Leo170]
MPRRSEAVSIPGGRAEMGTDAPVFEADGEAPRRRLTLKPFALDAVTVTNERFAAFVRERGYVTDAERLGWSFVFYQHLAGGADQYPRVQGADWWCRVDGAFWAAPEGGASNISERLDHPVVHVSHVDAQHFASWSGGRLPSEAEWEHAARGGLEGALFPWGNREPDDRSYFPCNIWQGDFPSRNTLADGYFSTAPARSFAPNGYGLYNCSGNVWEWCANAYRVSSLKRAAQMTNATALRDGWRVLKGGSFLCHRSYCYRYRIAARTGNPPDTSTSHIGFRVAYDL